MIRIALALFGSLFLVGTSQLNAADGPAPEIPELKPLSNYVGTWDTKITSSGTTLSKGQTTAKWILGGRYVQQTGYLKSEEGKIVFRMTTLMTYDTKAKKYRMWSFLPDGSMNEATGTWNEKTRTMTSIRHGKNSTSMTTANFSQKGIERWSIITKNQDGKVQGKIEGINTLKTN
ncbi:MAG: hypothetical protein Tsb009_31000 [Planctomycetaceae bacterium]